MGCICISGAPLSSNPGILNIVAMDAIFSFFFRSCSNIQYFSKRFWEECIYVCCECDGVDYSECYDGIKEKNSMPRQQSNSEDMETASEVLVTNLPLSSNWISDNMVS